MIGKCRVRFKEEEKEAKLYGIYQHSHVKQAIFRGEVGGVIAYPVAVVDWGEGVKEMPLSMINEIKEFNASSDYSLDAMRYVMIDGKDLNQLMGESMSNSSRGLMK